MYWAYERMGILVIFGNILSIIIEMVVGVFWTLPWREGVYWADESMGILVNFGNSLSTNNRHGSSTILVTFLGPRHMRV